MATNIFNLAAIDRIEVVVNATSAKIDALSAVEHSIAQAVTVIGKTLTDFIASLGGGDQPSIDAVTATLQQLTKILTETVARDQPPAA
jgi:phage-related protein